MNVELHGSDHFPWVRAAMLSLHDEDLEYALRSVSSRKVPPLESLMHDVRLTNMRRWIACLHKRFSDYPHLYSGGYFEPRRPQPVPASLAQRLIYSFGLITMMLGLPVTLPLALFLMR